MIKKYGLLVMLAGVGTVGCDLEDRSEEDINTDIPAIAQTNQTDEANAALSQTDGAEALDADEAEWNNIRWYTSRGPSGAGATRVMNLSASISSDGSVINYSWDSYPFSGNALGHFFWWNGSQWEGGKFEWITPPGQSVKQTKNIRNGYNQLRAPSPGTPVAFAWTSADGKRRSNLAKTTWR